MSSEQARHRFAVARVARLATADQAGRPHVVPFVFAVAGDTIYSAVDHKPKRTPALRRLAKIAGNGAVSALVDNYDDDWQRLWWVRADGSARIVDTASPEFRRALELLAARYPQYRLHPPEGPVIAIDVARWSFWDASFPQGCPPEAGRRR